MDACSGCGREGTLSNMFDAFGVLCCWDCSKNDAQFALISKSKAKEQFLLTESDVNQLASLERPNPKHKSWGSMKLLLLKQVRAKAVEKHGDLDKIQDLKRQREIKSLERTVEREKKKRSKQVEEETRVESTVKKLKQTLELHQHVFEEIQRDSDVMTRSCRDCGFTEIFQEF
jgi:DNA repair protein